MSKRVYISADYSANDGDRDVIDVLHKWASDNYHSIEFVDTAEVVSGSVSNDLDCRACDLKAEFNRQINASSTVIIVIGDMTKYRTAGSGCERSGKSYLACYCTPYKQNTNGAVQCKVPYVWTPSDDADFGNVNSYSYIRHEFEEAKKRGKNIVVVYNSLRRESDWLPSYMSEYEDDAHPFWTVDATGRRVGDYQFIKQALGYD